MMSVMQLTQISFKTTVYTIMNRITANIASLVMLGPGNMKSTIENKIWCDRVSDWWEKLAPASTPVITPFKIIQGRWFWYQSKARMQIHISE